MPSTLNGTDLFGFSALQQAAFLACLKYVEEKTALGASKFPMPPYWMLFPTFSRYEAEDVISMLKWMWENAGEATEEPPGYLASRGFNGVIGAALSRNVLDTAVGMDTVGWNDLGTNVSTINGASALVLGTSAGLGDTGGNVATKALNFAGFKTATLTATRTYSNTPWYDDAGTNASFQTNFFFNKIGSALMRGGVANWSYGRVDALQNAPAVIVYHRKTHTAAPTLLTLLNGSTQQSRTMTQVNPGTAIESTGPINMQVKVTKAGNAVTVDVYYNNIHRYTYTETNALIGAWTLGNGCIVAHAHNYTNPLTVNLENAAVALTY